MEWTLFFVYVWLAYHFLKTNIARKISYFPFQFHLMTQGMAEKFFLGHENVKVQYFSIAMVYIDI